MNKRVRGTVTVEAAVIVPLILVLFILLVNCLFYVHDKNVIGAAAYETVALGSGRNRMDEQALETHFQQRIEKRMWLFSEVAAKVTVTGEEIEIRCEAEKNKMTFHIERSMRKTHPEDYIRSKRKLHKLGNL